MPKHHLHRRTTTPKPPRTATPTRNKHPIDGRKSGRRDLKIDNDPNRGKQENSSGERWGSGDVERWTHTPLAGAATWEKRESLDVREGGGAAAAEEP
jgi:hypothetical protein